MPDTELGQIELNSTGEADAFIEAVRRAADAAFEVADPMTHELDKRTARRLARYRVRPPAASHCHRSLFVPNLRADP